MTNIFNTVCLYFQRGFQISLSTEMQMTKGEDAV